MRAASIITIVYGIATSYVVYRYCVCTGYRNASFVDVVHLHMWNGIIPRRQNKDKQVLGGSQAIDRLREAWFIKNNNPNDQAQVDQDEAAEAKLD